MENSENFLEIGSVLPVLLQFLSIKYIGVKNRVWIGCYFKEVALWGAAGESVFSSSVKLILYIFVHDM